MIPGGQVCSHMRSTEQSVGIINISIPILQKLESIDGIIELYGEKPELNNTYPFSSILYRKEMNNKLKTI